MSHHPPTGAAPVTQNERRADRAMHAIEAGSDCEFRDGAVAGLERDVRDLLANLRHLCDRWGLDHGAVDARAQTTYLGDHTEAPLVALGAPGALDREAEPVRVVIVDHDARVSSFAASAPELFPEVCDPLEMAEEAWVLLVGALVHGRAAEDPGSSPRRTLFVDEREKPVLAKQLSDLRCELLEDPGLAGMDLAEPDPPLASYLMGTPTHRSK